MLMINIHFYANFDEIIKQQYDIMLNIGEQEYLALIGVWYWSNKGNVRYFMCCLLF